MGLLSRLLGTRAPEDMPVHVDDGNFVAEVINSREPVLLDVWGPGCVPCQRLESVVIELNKRYRGRLKVAELNAAAAPRAVQRLGVRGTPTVVFFARGREVERVVGFRGELYFREIIESDLLPPETGKTA